jgi:nucleoside 2-deoxyribosyltransferase
MTPIFALQPLPKSIFLAGPTPRDPQASTWRPEALAILDNLGFEGQVYVPENANWRPHDQHEAAQVPWEWEALNLATVIVFWVPRVLATMPALTTNVEFGLFAHSGKIVLGYPPTAAKMTYLDRLAQRFHVPVYGTLRDTLVAAVAQTRRPFGTAPPGQG